MASLLPIYDEPNALKGPSQASGRKRRWAASLTSPGLEFDVLPALFRRHGVTSGDSVFDVKKAYLKAYGIESEYRLVANTDYAPDDDPKMKGQAILKGLKKGSFKHYVFTEGIVEGSVEKQLIVLDPAGNGTGGPALAEFDRFRPYRKLTYRTERTEVTFDIEEVITFGPAAV